MALMATRTKISKLFNVLSTRMQDSRYGYGRFYNLGSSSYSSSALATEETETFGVKDYEDYRKSRYGDITHKAVLVDAVGTLVVPSQPMAEVLFFTLLM